jgi:hypothetical protein
MRHRIDATSVGLCALGSVFSLAGCGAARITAPDPNVAYRTTLAADRATLRNDLSADNLSACQGSVRYSSSACRQNIDKTLSDIDHFQNDVGSTQPITSNSPADNLADALGMTRISAAGVLLGMDQIDQIMYQESISALRNNALDDGDTHETFPTHLATTLQTIDSAAFTRPSATKCMMPDNDMAGSIVYVPRGSACPSGYATQ